MIQVKRWMSKKNLKTELRILAALKKRAGRILFDGACVIGALSFFAAVPEAKAINLDAIAMIESGGDPMAVGRDGDLGMYQITPILLSECNLHFDKKISMKDLFNPVISRRVADWYLHKRIPEMLRHFKKPVTDRNVLISWNAGIAYVVKGKPLPAITRAYLKKYAQKNFSLQRSVLSDTRSGFTDNNASKGR